MLPEISGEPRTAIHNKPRRTATLQKDKSEEYFDKGIYFDIALLCPSRHYHEEEITIPREHEIQLTDAQLVRVWNYSINSLAANWYWCEVGATLIIESDQRDAYIMSIITPGASVRLHDGHAFVMGDFVSAFYRSDKEILSKAANILIDEMG